MCLQVSENFSFLGDMCVCSTITEMHSLIIAEVVKYLMFLFSSHALTPILRSLMDMVAKMLPITSVITCHGSSWKMLTFLLSLKR